MTHIAVCHEPSYARVTASCYSVYHMNMSYYVYIKKFTFLFQIMIFVIDFMYISSLKTCQSKNLSVMLSGVDIL